MKNVLVKMLLGAAFCFVGVLGTQKEVKADFIYFPQDEFVEKNREDCDMQENHYGGRMYEAKQDDPVYQEPDGARVATGEAVVAKGKNYRVYYVYTNPVTSERWGCIESRLWLKMNGMKLIYDGKEFDKDHEDEIGAYKGDLMAYEVTFPMNLYDYPGSSTTVDHVDTDYNKEAPIENWMTPRRFYRDEQGKLWGYLFSYNMGYYRGWYCISDLPESPVKDYSKNGRIDLEDAQMVLKAALKITALDGKTGSDVSMEDAQTVLKQALKISDGKTILLKEKN